MAYMPQFENEDVQRKLDAGEINPDGTGVPTEYPKMMFKKGAPNSHLLGEKPLKIQGEHDVQTRTVRSLVEEQDAIADGWFLTTSLQKTAAQLKAEEDAAKDAELAKLRAQVADKPADKLTLSAKEAK